MVWEREREYCHGCLVELCRAGITIIVNISIKGNEYMDIDASDDAYFVIKSV